MMLLAFNVLDPNHVEFVHRDFPGLGISSKTKGIIAHDSEGRVMGGILFEGWTGNAVFGHVSVRNKMCLRPGGLVDEALNYVFRTCGLEYFLGMLPADKTKAFNFEKKIGFSEMYRLEDGCGPGEDLIFMKLSRNEYLNRRAA